MRKLWPFSFYVLLYAAVAFGMPYQVLYFQELGFNGTQIGLVTGITPLVTFFTAPLWSGFADTSGRHRLFMSVALLGSVITLFIFPFLTTFLPVLLIAMLLYLFLAPVTPFSDSATMNMLADKKEMYGRVRLGGTLGFGVTATIAGVFVQNYGLRIAFWGAATLLLLGLFVSQKLVYGHSTADNPSLSRVRIMVSNPRWIIFLCMAFFGGVSLAASNNYFFPYLQEVGAPESLMGFALTLGTLSEVPVLFFGNQLIRRLKPYGLFMFAMVITGLRMLLLAAVSTTSLVFLVQLLAGLTFPAMWIAGVSYADENAAAGMRTTAQGLFSAMVIGIGTAAGGFFGGILLESIGGRGLYLVYGLTVLVVVAIAGMIYRRLPVDKEIAFSAADS